MGIRHNRDKKEDIWTKKQSLFVHTHSKGLAQGETGGERHRHREKWKEQVKEVYSDM